MIEPDKPKFADSSLHNPAVPQDHEMEVLTACDERYLPHAATMLCSLLEHNSVSRIHFFYSSIASHELEKLKSLVARYRSEIVLYKMAPTEFEGFRADDHLSIATYYRLLAPRLLPPDLDKVLYLDADIIVRHSLNMLWCTDLADHALAAVSNYEDNPRKALGLPAGTQYFNAGVLLINLRFWRKHMVLEGAVAFIKDNPGRVRYNDQDALNAILANQWIALPPGWNAQMDEWRPFPPGTESDPAIVHFVTSNKPWQWSNEHPFKREYRKYRLKTPWWQYRLEGQPGLPQRLGRSLRRFARIVMPDSLRRWLRSRVMSSQA
jgi:lipopolysaccharide biosynthesis glycosyltransferase